MAELINAGIQPLQNPNVAHFHSPHPDQQKKWNQHWIKKGLTAYEKLAQETAGKFSMGNQITLADLFLIPQCYNAKRNDILLSQFPQIEKIYQAAMETEACKNSAPEKYAPQEK